MTVFALKLLAALSMLVDHVGWLLGAKRLISNEVYILLRTLGRFAMPLYCFLMAEGWRQLRREPERLRRHFRFLLVLAALSEVLFDWYFYADPVNPGHQSVIITLLLGFCALTLAGQEQGRALPVLLICGSAGVLGYLLSSDYKMAGVLLVCGFGWYLCRFETWEPGLRLLALTGILGAYFAFLTWSGTGFGGPAALLRGLARQGWYMLPHLLLVPLLAAYNGRLGPRIPVLHRCYQWFYPLHLAVLSVIAAIIG